MKAARLALLAALGMTLTSVSVYSLTPAGGFSRGSGAETVPSAEQVPESVKQPPAAPAERSRFVDGVAQGSRAPVNLALVIDRSGSMKGTRIRNAISAAQSAVDRLNDGDVVSVVTFDTQTQVVVPVTTVGPGARERVNAA